MNFKPFPGFTKAQNQWLFEVYKINPALYQVAVDEYKAGAREMNVGGLGIDWGGLFSKVASSVEKVAPSLIQLKQQKDALALQKKQLAADTAIRTTAIKSGYGDPGAGYASGAMVPTVAAPGDIYSQYGVPSPSRFQGGIGGIPVWALAAAAGVAIIYFMKR